MSSEHGSTRRQIADGDDDTTSNSNINSNSNDTTGDPGVYYDKGSVELAVETPVMLKRLEKRQSFTTEDPGVGGLHGKDDYAERLLIVLVGLPARGKSFIARKLQNYMLWRGNHCRTFNVGKYRRTQVTSDNNEEERKDKAGEKDSKLEQKASFFDDSNHDASKLRQKAAQMALNDTLEWLEEGDTEDKKYGSKKKSSSKKMDEYFIRNHVSYSQRRKHHRIAIFDATNTTNERRTWILQECAKADGTTTTTTTTAQQRKKKRRTGVLFLESICDDEELLQENLQFKIVSSPDFEGIPLEEALEDLKQRIAIYESRYEPMNDPHQSYIKIFNLSSRLQVNHIYGRLAKTVLPAIMAWNTGSRPIFLCRAGETKAMEAYMRQLLEQQEKKNEKGKTNSNKFEDVVQNRTRRRRRDRLGERGLRFREALCDFIEQEGMAFMKRKTQNAIHPSKMATGTSISGLHEEEEHPFEYESCRSMDMDELLDDNYHNGPSHPQNKEQFPFPCLIMSSTMPRAVETATWKHPFPVKDVTNLNPIDMGDFSGMDLTSIQEQHPEWYEELKRDPFHTRCVLNEFLGL